MLWFLRGLLRRRGRSPRWPALRRCWLLAHPECAACGGRERLEVHHLLPVSFDPSRELDEANLITLCEGSTRNCHLWIGHAGDWRARNPHCRVDAAWWRARVAHREYRQ